MKMGKFKICMVISFVQAKQTERATKKPFLFKIEYVIWLMLEIL